MQKAISKTISIFTLALLVVSMTGTASESSSHGQSCTDKYKGQTMTDLPDEIFRKWMHSFEEDQNGVIVYRPTEYEFPRARGRDGIEFRPDGVFIAWEIGPTDATRGINGHWKMEGSGRVRVSFEDNVREPRVLEILQCDAGILKVRKLPASS